MWDLAYQKQLVEKVGKKLPELSDYPFLRFPNEEYASLIHLYPQEKVLLFGYGSLINKQSASRSVKPEAIETMRTAIAFGGKRVFNYQAKKRDHWGANQHRKEQALLNLTPSLNMNALTNGIVMEVDQEDLAHLVQRETGYDLVPILVASWDDALAQKQDIEIKIAYTFIASPETRGHTLYTSTQYYPVLGYLHAVQEGSLEYGDAFAHFWNATTYLADGTTPLSHWDQKTFDGILCARQFVEDLL